MSADRNAAPWSCVGAVGSKSMRTDSPPHQDYPVDPHFTQPPLILKDHKASAKCLKPDKWRAAFDEEGKAVGFHKLLKNIALGGVEHSIRAEVWEFLLGCYALGTTSQYREQLREARRERYRKLVEQCQKLHASIGTGSLAYTVGSKVMDVRIMSKDSARREAKIGVQRVSVVETQIPPETTHRRTTHHKVDETDFPGSPQFDNSDEFPAVFKYESPAKEGHGLVGSGGFDYREGFIQLPVRRLFDASDHDVPDADMRNYGMDDCQRDHLPGQVDAISLGDIDVSVREVTAKRQAECMPRTNVRDDVGPLRRSAGSFKKITSRFVRGKRKKALTSNIGFGNQSVVHSVYRQESDEHQSGLTKVSDPVANLARDASEERVAEWLWTLHKIVVDVVRTDRHLVFYGDARNMARMSDILAVYAWIDPATGYCQGMSDLLSPFIVLFDDDADAFWCFESLLRRVRQNFQMEGPVGVMKQLEALPRILDVTDSQMSKHLGLIGANSFLFAFRMLLVLFRRELSFGEALYMWEMMWAADFKQSMAMALEHNCLDALSLSIPCQQDLMVDSGKCDENSFLSSTLNSFSTVCDSPAQDFRYDHSFNNNLGSTSNNFGLNLLGKKSPFCGLRPGALLTKNRQREGTVSSILGRNGDEELSVFCVAAILVENRSKILKELQSMDDAIKMFNDMEMKIGVHNSIHTAIKLRKKYRTRVERPNCCDCLPMCCDGMLLK